VIVVMIVTVPSVTVVIVVAVIVMVVTVVIMIVAVVIVIIVIAAVLVVVMTVHACGDTFIRTGSCVVVVVIVIIVIIVAVVIVIIVNGVWVKARGCIDLRTIETRRLQSLLEPGLKPHAVVDDDIGGANVFKVGRCGLE